MPACVMFVKTTPASIFAPFSADPLRLPLESPAHIAAAKEGKPAIMRLLRAR